MNLSIITVVKNDKSNLETTIKSVLSQNYKNFEYIIFDGMSSDGISSVINKYKSHHIRYIRKRDKNYYDGLNQAIKNARGNFIGILNAGDIYSEKNVLKIVMNKILKKKCDILFSNLKYFDKNNKISRIWKFKVSNLNKLNALKIASPTLFIKKKIADFHIYNTNYHISSDTDFNIRIANKNYNFVYLDKFIVLMKNGGLSTRYSLLLDKMFQDLLILKKHFGLSFFFIYIYKIFLKIL